MWCGTHVLDNLANIYYFFSKRLYEIRITCILDSLLIVKNKFNTLNKN